MIEIETRRLTSRDREEARNLFILMAQVFSEECNRLTDRYLEQLLGRIEFWAIAAFCDGEIVGGITAHTLPMTKAESSEVFIYDIAVRADRQRQGVGRSLMKALCQQASDAGIHVIFVPADNEDVHALDFYRALGGEAAPVTFFTFEAGNL